MDDKDVAKIIDWWEGEQLDVEKRNAYWKALSSARKEFDQLPHHTKPYWNAESGIFKMWLHDTYGIEMHYEGANISGKFKVIDEQKYTIFLLKHGVN